MPHRVTKVAGSLPGLANLDVNGIRHGKDGLHLDGCRQVIVVDGWWSNPEEII